MSEAQDGNLEDQIRNLFSNLEATSHDAITAVLEETLRIYGRAVVPEAEEQVEEATQTTRVAAPLAEIREFVLSVDGPVRPCVVVQEMVDRGYTEDGEFKSLYRTVYKLLRNRNFAYQCDYGWYMPYASARSYLDRLAA